MKSIDWVRGLEAVGRLLRFVSFPHLGILQEVGGGWLEARLVKTRKLYNTFTSRNHLEGARVTKSG